MDERLEKNKNKNKKSFVPRKGYDSLYYWIVGKLYIITRKWKYYCNGKTTLTSKKYSKKKLSHHRPWQVVAELCERQWPSSPRGSCLQPDLTMGQPNVVASCQIGLVSVTSSKILFFLRKWWPVTTRAAISKPTKSWGCLDRLRAAQIQWSFYNKRKLACRRWLDPGHP